VRLRCAVEQVSVADPSVVNADLLRGTEVTIAAVARLSGDG
jgi:hypothetical protein